MADYISKQRAKDLMGCCLASAKVEYKSAKDEFTKARFEDYISTIQAMINVVGSVEAADVQPVKRGKWEEEQYNDCFHCYSAICSECHCESTDFYSITDTHSFCEYCGARMDGDAE